MSRNHKFFFDKDGSPRARGPVSEKMFMSFLETDVQGSDHVCRVLMDDLTAIEDKSDDSREFVGNAHTVTLTPSGAIITTNPAGSPSGGATSYTVPLKHFREILEDWEAFIFDDQIDDELGEDDYQ